MTFFNSNCDKVSPLELLNSDVLREITSIGKNKAAWSMHDTNQSLLSSSFRLISLEDEFGGEVS